MRKLLPTLLLLSLSLAGCSEDTAPSSDPDPFDEIEVEPVADGKGLIRGVIIDNAVQPIAGAKVKLVSLGLEVTSSDAGAFVFNDLEPGTYFVEASRVGYSTAQSSNEVVAGVAKPPILKIQLTLMPGSEPRAETVQGEGFVQCGAGTPLTIHECPGLNDQDNSQLELPAPGDNPTVVQAEITWKSTQPAGEQLYLIVKHCGTPCDWGFEGRWSEGVMDSPHIARTTGENRTALQTGVWASAGGPANGTGAAIDQPFYVYVTYFYNIDSPDEGWTFLGDGAYQTGE